MIIPDRGDDFHSVASFQLINHIITSLKNQLRLCVLEVVSFSGSAFSRVIQTPTLFLSMTAVSEWVIFGRDARSIWVQCQDKLSTVTYLKIRRITNLSFFDWKRTLQHLEDVVNIKILLPILLDLCIYIYTHKSHCSLFRLSSSVYFEKNTNHVFRIMLL